mgnify:CR=1 FL=1
MTHPLLAFLKTPMAAPETARLRHDFYVRWLADPLRIDADARMPKYADDKGKTAFTGVRDGDAKRQFEAIWQHLGTLLPR